MYCGQACEFVIFAPIKIHAIKQISLPKGRKLSATNFENGFRAFTFPGISGARSFPPT